MALLPPTRNLRNEYRLRDPFAFGLSGVPYAFKTREEISQAGDLRKSCSPTADEHNLDLGLSIGSLNSQVTWDCDDDAPSVSASNTTVRAKSQGSQLTIFYAGMVIAYKDVNKELAKTIISLAHASGQMSKMTSQKFQSLCLEKKEMPVVKVQHIGNVYVEIKATGYETVF